MSIVQTIGDLTARHIGCHLTIPDLHRPGDDYDAPLVAVTDEYRGCEYVSNFSGVRVRLHSRWHRWGGVFRLDSLCHLASAAEVQRMHSELKARRSE